MAQGIPDGEDDSLECSSASKQAAASALRITLVYLLLGVAWIACSDSLLSMLAADPAMVGRLQTWKGWFYVAATAAALYVILYRLLRNDVAQLLQLQRQRRELHEFSQFRESIIDNASIWINVLDANAQIMVWNKAAEQISGYRKEEAIGNAGIWETLYPDAAYRAEIWARVRAILDDGYEVEGFETRMLCKDGQYKIMSWNQRRFFDASGGIGSIAIGQDVTERVQMQSELKRLAEHDVLTGLYNRRSFVTRAADALRVCTRANHAFAVLWIDIDGFKSVNDRLGHQVGDDVLQQVGMLLQNVAGEDGIAARYGGDEMVLALPEGTLRQAEALAETLRRRVQEANLLATYADSDMQTISIGVACRTEHAHDLPAILLAADQAMYRAKSAGRNRVCVAVDADGG